MEQTWSAIAVPTPSTLINHLFLSIAIDLTALAGVVDTLDILAPRECGLSREQGDDLDEFDVSSIVLVVGHRISQFIVG